MRRTAAIRKSLKNVTDNQGNGYTRTISNEAACQGVSRFFYVSYSEIKCQNIYYRFTASGHGTCGPSGEGIGSRYFKNILQNDESESIYGERTYLKELSEKMQLSIRQTLNRYVNQTEQGFKYYVDKIQKPRYCQSVYG